MSRERKWMPLYVSEYIGDTAHLTTEQHGAYLLLIMHYWMHGSLPQDTAALARICKLSRTRFESNCSAIAPLFKLGPWRHKRVEEELEKAKNVSERRALAGSKGGRSSRGLNNEQRFVASGLQAIAKQTGTHIHKRSISSTSEYVAAREEAEEEQALEAPTQPAAEPPTEPPAEPAHQARPSGPIPPDHPRALAWARFLGTPLPLHTYRGEKVVFPRPGWPPGARPEIADTG